MELRHLRYFLAVSEKLSFRKAADALNLSQPALSRQIKDLEQMIGVKLLERNTGGVALTVAGSVFLEEATDILERVDMAVSATREAHEGKAGRLTIGTVGALSATLLPPALSAFRLISPKVEVYLAEMMMSDQVNALRNGQIQVGFVIDRDRFVPSDMESTTVIKTVMNVAVSKDHPLADKGEVSLFELIEEPLAAIHISHYDNFHVKAIDNIFAVRGVRHRPVREVNSYDALVALIGGGHCISLLTESPKAMNERNISYLKIKEYSDDLDMYLSAIWRKGKVPSLIKEFIDVLRKSVDKDNTKTGLF